MGSGLLKKANLLSMKKGLAFSNFIQKYKSSIFAIFTKQDNFYFISNSLGFDGESILASYSTIDFWEGLISENNKIYNFSNDDNTLLKMLQFFSFEMKEKITKVSIYKNNDKIIFLCNEELSNEFIHDVNFLNENYESFDNSFKNNYSISLKPAVDSFIMEKAKYKASIHAVFRQALNHEILNRIILFFNCKDFSLNFSNSLIQLNSNITIDEKLLLTHLIFNINEVIGNKSKLIELSV